MEIASNVRFQKVVHCHKYVSLGNFKHTEKQGDAKIKTEYVLLMSIIIYINSSF